ncbi:MAG: hypothetical protein HY015_10545 [Bacteroidetes bacterium]|nr:hypothetical protein [Bacteroidota bacterium]
MGVYAWHGNLLPDPLVPTQWDNYFHYNSDNFIDIKGKTRFMKVTVEFMQD